MFNLCFTLSTIYICIHPIDGKPCIRIYIIYINDNLSKKTYIFPFLFSTTMKKYFNEAYLMEIDIILEYDLVN